MKLEKTMLQPTQELMDENLSLWLKTGLMTFLVALQIEIQQIGYLLVLVFFDSFFGSMRAIKLKEGFSIVKLWWGILSKLSLLFIPFLLAGFGLVFKINLIWTVEFFIIGIAINDLISIMASMVSMRRGRLVKSQDYIDKMITALMGFFTDFLKTKIDQFKGPEKNE
jgi:hypothetical protein